MKKLMVALGALVVALASTAASAQEKLIVSVWGGNWKDGAAIIAKEFTKRTGMEVEFITGGTLDRLAKAKVAKDNPESDVVYTTSHVGYLYQSDGLFEKLDKSKLSNFANLYPAADRGDYEVGVYSYVYSPVFRTDLMPKDFRITSWNDLWSDAVAGKLSMPDFDPSHIIVALVDPRRRRRRDLGKGRSAAREAQAQYQGLLPVGRDQARICSRRARRRCRSCCRSMPIT